MGYIIVILLTDCNFITHFILLELIKCLCEQKRPSIYGRPATIREAKRTDIKIVTGAGGAKDFYKAIQDNNDIKLATYTYSPLMVKKGG
jgi:hypothetical protein